MNIEAEKFEEEVPEETTKEEIKTAFKDVLLSWKEKLPLFMLKREANSVYHNREGKTLQQLCEELNEELEVAMDEVVKDKVDEVIENSGILSFYKERLHMGRIYAIGKNIMENSDPKDLTENMRKALEWEYRENIARSFLEPLLSDHIKHHLKKEGEEVEAIRKETIEHLLSNEQIKHHLSIEKERDALQKEMIKYLKKFE